MALGLLTSSAHGFLNQRCGTYFLWYLYSRHYVYICLFVCVLAISGSLVLVKFGATILQNFNLSFCADPPPRSSTQKKFLAYIFFALFFEMENKYNFFYPICHNNNFVVLCTFIPLKLFILMMISRVCSRVWFNTLNKKFKCA